MGSLKERFKAKLGKGPSKQPGSADTVDKRSSKSENDHAQTHIERSPKPSTSTASIPERLWNRAYDQAKESNASIAEAYEKILSARLREQDADVTNNAQLDQLDLRQNEIAADPETRRLQMAQLVESGLRKTENDANAKANMEESVRCAMTVKGSVDKAVQASPEAALPWVGVCIALEILMNPLTQSSSNRQGIAYVVSRMDWYWNMSNLLLSENLINTNSQGLRDELEKIITNLYAALLHFQMKSVCYYQRGRLSVWLRDTVKLDNWDGELSSIQAAEAAVQADSAQYNTVSIRNQLSAMAETAVLQNSKLDSVRSAVQEQTMKQERWFDKTADNKCLVDLRVTDPRLDKERIEKHKGGLLKDAYVWIFDNAYYQEWRNDPQKHLLWVKADPGMGKTMLLCGIIDELQKSLGPTDVLSYFFCQATDPRINNATAVLRGLVYLLATQQPSLMAHVRKRYDQAGETLFKDANSFVALSEIFRDMTEDSSFRTCYLFLDALDECVTDLPKLLRLLTDHLGSASRIKWIVTSRNLPDIEEWLQRPSDSARVELKLSADNVSEAVRFFVKQRVGNLAKQKGYSQKLHDTVSDYLNSNADSTFLWVALVCQDLELVPRWRVLTKLKGFSPGLKALYERMMQQVNTSVEPELCKQILALATVAYRPVTSNEVVSLIESFEDLDDDLDSVGDIVNLCGSFLTMREDTLYFVHQSAKDFLLTEAFDDVFPEGSKVTHRAVFSKSVAILSRDLRRDIYGLKAPGYLVEDVNRPIPDPLRASLYSSVYWVKHLSDSILHNGEYDGVDFQAGGVVDVFLRNKFLNWLEALSLGRNISEGIASMGILHRLIQTRDHGSKLNDFIEDGRRFLMSFKIGIEEAPLQTYTSALLFSPKHSLTRQTFLLEQPSWVTINPHINDNWGACLLTLKGHASSVKAVAFSHDSTQLATASADKTIKIWDVNSGALLQTLKGHTLAVRSVAFSHDSALLASCSNDQTIKIWNQSGDCLRTLEGHRDKIVGLAFSADSMQLASNSAHGTVKIWNVDSGICIRTLEDDDHLDHSPVAYSHKSNKLASTSSSNNIKIWDTNTWLCLHTLSCCREQRSVVFSHDLSQLALSRGNFIEIWDASSEACLRKLEGHNGRVTKTAYSPDSIKIASSSIDHAIKIWDVKSGACLRTLRDPGSPTWSLHWTHDSTLLVSGSFDGSTRLWDVRNTAHSATDDRPEARFHDLAVSPDSRLLATGRSRGAVQLWDVNSGACLKTLDGLKNTFDLVTFSPDSTMLALASADRTIKVCNLQSDAILSTMKIEDNEAVRFTISHDSKLLAATSYGKTSQVWDIASGVCLQTIHSNGGEFCSVAFSPTSTQLVTGSIDRTVQIWDLSSGVCLRSFDSNTSRVPSPVFSSDSTQIASKSTEGELKIWDASSGACLQTFPRFGKTRRLKFDSASLCLNTDFGPVFLRQPSDFQETDAAEPFYLQYRGVSLSLAKDWITYDGEPVLWLPPEYRPSVSAVFGTKIALACDTGRLWILDVNAQKLEDA